MGVLHPVPVLAIDAADESDRNNFCGGGSKGSSNTSTRLSGKKVTGAKLSWELTSLAMSDTSNCSCVNISFLLRSLAFSALRNANSSAISSRGEEVDGEASARAWQLVQLVHGTRSSWQLVHGTYRNIKSLCFFEAINSSCGMSTLSTPVIFADLDWVHSTR